MRRFDCSEQNLTIVPNKRVFKSELSCVSVSKANTRNREGWHVCKLAWTSWDPFLCHATLHSNTLMLHNRERPLSRLKNSNARYWEMLENPSRHVLFRRFDKKLELKDYCQKQIIVNCLVIRDAFT